MRKRPVALKDWFEKVAFYKSGSVDGTVFNKDQVIKHGYFTNLLYKFQFVCKQILPICAHTAKSHILLLPHVYFSFHIACSSKAEIL